jgi:hypothetical protein
MATKPTSAESTAESTPAAEPKLAPMPPQIAAKPEPGPKPERVITGIGGKFETRPIKRSEQKV